MIELLTAVFVIAVGILGLFGALSYGLTASRSGELRSEAVGHATHLIELIRSRNLDFQGSPPPPPASSGINDTPGTKRALDAAPFATEFPAGSPFQRSIQLTREGASGDYNYEVMRITVTLYWQEQGGERNLRFEALHKNQ